jgi:tryptophanyl-tRNA synthetase
MATRSRILSGITPTGKMHLGHWVGAIESWVRLTDEYDCFYLLANKHAFSTRADKPDEIRQSVLDLATDLLACGLTPDRCVLCVQSEIPAIDELTFFFSMLLPFNRVMRNPTLAEEIRDKGLGDHYPFGFPLYAVGQTADILAFRPAMVPVGEDQIPHLEMTREVARRFNQLYCGVSPHTEDADAVRAGGLFPVIEPKLGRVRRMVGLGPPGPSGNLLKMSKSLNNAIFFDDEPEIVQKKVMGMYTDPNRITGREPGETDPAKNPLWAFHEIFNSDTGWVDEHRRLYAEGKVGDVPVKRKLVEVLNATIDPIRARRRELAKRPDDVIDALRDGTRRANEAAEETLALAKAAMKQDFFGGRRQLSL